MTFEANTPEAVESSPAGWAPILVFGLAFATLIFASVAALLDAYRWEGAKAAVSRTYEMLGSLDRFEWFVDDGVSATNARLADPSNVSERDRAAKDLAGARQLASELVQLAASESDAYRIAMHLPRMVEENAKANESTIAIRRLALAPHSVAAQNPVEFPDDIDDAVESLRAQQWVAFRTRIKHEESLDRRARTLLFGALAAALFLMAGAAWRAREDQRKRLAAERALVASELKYREVVETAGDIIFRTDKHGRFTYCNQAARAVIHLSEQEILGRSYLKLVRQDKRRDVANFYLRQFARQKKNTYYEYPVVDGHGGERWLGQNLQLLMGNGQVLGFQGIARDITERRRAEADLARSRSFVERIAATTPGILYVYDLDEKRHVFTNREADAVLGLQPGGAENYFARCAERFHPDDLPTLAQHQSALRHAADGEVRRVEYRVRHTDGHWVWFASRDTPFERREDGLVRRIVGIAQDITERRAAQEAMSYQANFDALTGLANRHHFSSRMDSLVPRLGVGGRSVVLCLIDIDHLKEINDRHGHLLGDEVLESLGAIMRSELRSNDIASRLGGDEFCFVAVDADLERGTRIAERILERLSSQAFGLSSDKGPFAVTATIGLAEWRPGMDERALLNAADKSLYGGKSAGRNRVFAEG